MKQTKKTNNRKKTGGSKKGTANKGRKWTVPLAAGLVAVTAIVALTGLRLQRLSNTEAVTLYVPTGSDYAAVCDSLAAHGCLDNKNAFDIMARLRKYRSHVKGGCYKLEAGMNTWASVTKLYYGNQDAVRITINKHRTLEQLCNYLDKRLELDGDTLLALLSNDSICAALGHNRQTVIAMFVQNTYDIYWNTSPQRLLERMADESDRFWNDERRKKCKALELTSDEVVTLASIVEEETNKNDEKANIASVYLNRLRQGMPLQADPTLKYAAGDFTIRRLLNKHIETDSPYNTYKHRGLPPGPICIPGTASIDAVLANKQTGYLYFCAKADFSGYHAFASTLAQHNANAAAFHAEMNRRKIYK